MRKFSRHTTLTTTLTIAVTLISFGLLTDTSSAERFYQGRAALGKNCTATGGIFTVENSGAFSCMRPEGGMSINCSASGSCAMVDLNRLRGHRLVVREETVRVRMTVRVKPSPTIQTGAGTASTPRSSFQMGEAPVPTRSNRAFRSKMDR
jgi:hypothetical protein